MLLGFGCNTATEVMMEQAAGGKADVEVKGDVVSVTTEEGSAEWGANTLPDNWPSDVPVYAGATVQFSGSATPTQGNQGVSVMLQTNDTAPKVLDFYKNELTAQGWKIEGSYQAGQSATLAASKDTRNVGVTIVANGETTAITVGVVTK